MCQMSKCKKKFEQNKKCTLSEFATSQRDTVIAFAGMSLIENNTPCLKENYCASKIK